MVGIRSSKQKWCWDNCVFSAWMTDDHPDKTGDIKLAIDNIESSSVELYVSTIVLHEMYSYTGIDQFSDSFADLFERTNVHVVDVDARIAQVAASIRRENAVLRAAKSKQLKHKKIMAVDSIVLATGVVYAVNFVHTMDDNLLKATRTTSFGNVGITLPKDLTGQRSLFHE